MVDNLTDEQLHNEIAGSKSSLEQLGFEVETFIYPYYEWDDRFLEYVRDAGYRRARGGWPEEGGFRMASINEEIKYHLPS